MPIPFHGGARLRCAAVLMLATLVCVPAAVAAAPSSAGDARGGVAGGTDGLPDDPTGADLGAAVGSLGARIRAERAEAAAAARSLGQSRARLEAADTALAAARRGVDALVSGAGVLATPRTGRPRAVLTVIYFADGCHRRNGKQTHPSVDRAGIPPGGVIQSPVTPIAWPRPPGDLPSPPTDPRPGADHVPPGLFPRRR